MFQSEYTTLYAAVEAYGKEKDRQKQCAIYHLDAHGQKHYIWRLYDRRAFGKARIKELNEAIENNLVAFKVELPRYYYSLGKKDSDYNYCLTTDLSGFGAFSHDMDDVENKFPKKWMDWTQYINQKSLAALLNIIENQLPNYPCTTCSSNHMNKNGGDCGVEESGCDDYDRYYNYAQGRRFGAKKQRNGK